MSKALALAVAVLVSFSVYSSPRGVAPRRGVSPAQARVFAAPPLRESARPAEVVQRLPRLSAFEIEALRRANANDDGPLQLGVVRAFDHAVAVDAGVRAAGAEAWSWRGTVAVDGAHRLRVQLTDVDLPADAVLWVYGAAGAAIGFDLATLVEGTLWTPSIEGNAVTVEVRASRGSFRIAGVADIRPEWEVTASGTECFRDLACHSEYGVTASATAIAQYTFITGSGGVAACSGGLILDMAETFAPYFLTARHCVSTSSEAATLEATWDYRAAICNGIAPSRASLPKTFGAQLLTTSAATDVTLLRLSNVPGERYWLGWTPDPLPAGTIVHRVSHPQGGPQRFSASIVDAAFSGCSTATRPSYIYHRPTVGGTTGGSSGAPLIVDDGYIVGQLRSGCGPDPSNGCNYQNRDVDGALAQSMAVLQPFIDPTNQPSTCTTSGGKLCLNGNRFELTVTWRTNDGKSGSGTAVPMSGDTGYFWFFGSSNVELVIKVLDARAVNGKFWLFYGALSNVGYTLTVRDTQTGKIRTYENPINNLASVADTNAF